MACCFARGESSSSSSTAAPDGLEPTVSWPCTPRQEAASPSDEDELTSEQAAFLAEMRARLGSGGASADDTELVRFLRARKWDVEAACRQFEATMRWRAENDVGRYRRNAPGPVGVAAAAEAAADPHLSRCGVECFPQLRLVEPKADEGIWGYFGLTVAFGFDKLGHPIYLQRAGLASCRFAPMFEMGGRRGIIEGHIRMQEMQQARMEEKSAEIGRRVTKQVVIMDLQGLTMKPDPRAMAVFRDFILITARYYPETLAMQFFVNVPLVFMALWRVIRGWLDPVTAAKMQLLGSDFRTTLLQHIDADQLPREFGGTNDFDALAKPLSADGWTSLFREFETAAQHRWPRRLPELSRGGKRQEEAGRALPAAPEKKLSVSRAASLGRRAGKALALCIAVLLALLARQ
eukprot:TRINITY_DN31909_c0_g1_i1.p1 TRINITY_DN31909_c0_g1~~TRINITY_DN31909_c0_g1_i1.p1  ORF type:complete len:405 (+),score=97.91 TRINITY_DN31909_c0_g1_i1:65-1279(+)